MEETSVSKPEEIITDKENTSSHAISEKTQYTPEAPKTNNKKEESQEIIESKTTDIRNELAEEETKSSQPVLEEAENPLIQNTSETPKVEKSILNPESKNTGIEHYEVDKEDISLAWKRFDPEQPQELEANFYLGSWGQSHKGGPAGNVSKELTKASGSPTISIDTRMKHLTPESAEQEAEAVLRFIKESGVKKITLIGSSHGGVPVGILAARIPKENPEITVNGVVFLDGVGLYERDADELMKDLKEDLLVATPREVFGTLFGKLSKEEQKKVIEERIEKRLEIGEKRAKRKKGNASLASLKNIMAWKDSPVVKASNVVLSGMAEVMREYGRELGRADKIVNRTKEELKTNAKKIVI